MGIKNKIKHSWRRIAENILSLILLIIALYLLVTPFAPIVGLWVAKSTDKTNGFVYASTHPLTPQNLKNNIDNVDSNIKPIPKDNRLVIPSINVDISINDGPDARSLRTGGWHRPKTSTPDKGGNTVIAAHRFTYTNPASYFYNLPNVKVGDPIIVYWQGKEYNYEVTEQKEVKPTQIEIENNTTFPELTLYTCTLWTAKDRVVVIAKPV